MDIESTDFKDDLSKEFDDFYTLEFKIGCSIKFDIENECEIERFYTFNQQEFLEYLIKGCNSRNKHIVYFHNLAFDSKFFIDFLYEHFAYVIPIRTGGRIPLIRCYRQRKNKSQYDCILEIKDSYTLLDGSLKVLGDAIGKPKLDFDFDYFKIQESLEYCFRDCEIPFYAMLKIVKAIKNNFNLINNRTKKPFSFYDLPLTIASLMKKLIMFYYPKAMYKVDKHIEYHLRSYYFGGRTDAYDFNCVYDAIYLDVNSMYVNELIENLFANGKVYSYLSDIIEFEKDYSILAYEVEIKENIDFPLYPTRLNNKIFYLKGFKKAILTRKEYFWFKKHNFFKNKKIEIIQVIREFRCYEQTKFDTLFTILYNLRLQYEKENIYNYIFKKLLASSHGKFAEKYIKECYKLINKDKIKDINFDNGNIYDIDNRLMEKKEIANDFLKVNLFNGVLTTSYARFTLWKMIQKCNKKGIKVYYSDTDSIVVSNTNLNKLSKYLSETKIGFWKKEQKFQEFQAIDSKEYYFIIKNNKKEKEFHVKFKGIKNERLNTKNKLLTHIKKGTKVNLVGSFFYCFNRHGNTQNVYIVHKHKKSYYHKRIINNDLTTNPLTNNDLNNLQLIEQQNKQLLLQQLQIKV